jgi:hypothetical protein
VNHIKQVCNSSKDCHGHLKLSGDLNAAIVEVLLVEVEKEGVYKDCHQARSPKERVPFVQRWACRVQALKPGALGHVIIHLGRAL